MKFGKYILHVPHSILYSIHIIIHFYYLDAVQNLTYAISDEKLYNLYSIFYKIRLDVVTLTNTIIFSILVEII